MKRYIKTTLHQFLNEQQENVKLYHGSNSMFNEFDDSKISDGDGSDLFGKGYYLTDNIEVANFYAKLITKKDKIKDYKPTGVFKSYEPTYSDDSDEYSEKNKKINTFYISGNILNTEEYILDNDFIKVIRESFKKYSHLGDQSYQIFDRTIEFLRSHKNKINNYRGELLYIIQQIGFQDKNIIIDIISQIKNLGYDGVKYRPDSNFEGNIKSWNYVIYNKSIFKKD